MKKELYLLFFTILSFNSLAFAWDITEQQDTPEKELHERRLQNRLFKERYNSEMPYTRDAEIIKEKKERQGDWIADAVQNRIDAYKRQQQQVENKELEQKRVENKVIQQQLESKRLEDARIRRKLEDAEWERRHRR